MSGSPHHQSSTVWKVLHGAPPTPPAARRDPDRFPNAGQQQKAAAAGQAAPASPGSYLQQQQQQYQHQTIGLSSSAVSLQLSPTLHKTSGPSIMHQHSISMDDSILQQQQGVYPGDMQQQTLQHQTSASRQAWPTLSSPKGQSPARSPWSKLPAVTNATSPDPESRNQVAAVSLLGDGLIHSRPLVCDIMIGSDAC